MILTSIAVLAVTAQANYTLAPAGSMIGVEAVALAAAPTGPLFAAGLPDNTVRIIDATTRATKMTLSGHNFPCRAIAWSPKGDRIATGSENAEIRIWNAKTGALISSTKGAHQRTINGLWFNSAGTRLISTGDDDASKVWNVSAMARPLATILGKGANIYGTKFADSQRIIAGTLGNGVVVYSASSFQPAFTLGGHPGNGALDVDVNEAGTRAVSAGKDGMLGVWDMQKKTRISYLRGHTDWVTKVRFDPTGQFVLSSGTDGTVCVWDTKGLRRVARLEGMSYVGSPIAWVDGGKMAVACADDNFIRIYKFVKV